MISIELHNIRLHAFHGIFEGEEKLGNDYIINLDVIYEEGTNSFDDINATISYVDLYEIVKQRMQIPTGLLEKVCESIIRRIKHQYPFVKEVSLSIHKLQAPISQLEGSVGVRMNKKFNE
jgi:dihydroneopterin aldolase